MSKPKDHDPTRRDPDVRDPAALEMDDLWSRWERVEAAEDDELADEALGALFEALPLEAPSPQFAARTLERARRAGLLSGARRAEVAEARPVDPLAWIGASWWRRAAAVWLSGAGLGLLALLGYALATASRAGTAGVRDALVATFTGAWEWIASGLALWQGFSEFGGWVAWVVQVPEVSTLLLVATLVATGAFWGLRRLLLDERSWTDGELSYAELH